MKDGPQFSISIIQTRKTAAKTWEDAELEAEIWSLDEKAAGHSVSALQETPQ
jgi:hypothetical protein